MDKQSYLKQIDEVINAGPYKATWDSLANHKTPQWFLDAKFGTLLLFLDQGP